MRAFSSGTTPWVANRHKAISRRCARATTITLRMRRPAPLTRSRNQHTWGQRIKQEILYLNAGYKPLNQKAEDRCFFLSYYGKAKFKTFEPYARTEVTSGRE